MNNALEFRNGLLKKDVDFNNNIMYGKSNGLIRDFGEDEVNVFNLLSNNVVTDDIVKAFEQGYNIGRCRYFAHTLSYAFEDCSIVTGKLPILEGTPGSPNGIHVWLEVEDKIYDTTLLMVINKEYLNKLGYIKQNRLDDNVIQNDEIYKSRKERFFDLVLNKKIK